MTRTVRLTKDMSEAELKMIAESNMDSRHEHLDSEDSEAFLSMDEMEEIAQVLRDSLPDNTCRTQLGLLLFSQMKLKLESANKCS
jgi:hypothetical protein